MDHEYTTSTGYKIFYGIIAAVIAGAAILVPALQADGGFSKNPALLLAPVLGLAAAAFIIANTIKRKVIIADDGITVLGLWSSKTLTATDINGYRMGDKGGLVIEPVGSAYSKLIINYQTFAENDDLLQRIKEKYKNLDQEQFEEEKNEILHDASLGATETDREELLNKTKKYTGLYTGVGAALFFISVFLPVLTNAFSPLLNSLLVILMLIYPIIGLVMMHYGKGLIKLLANKNSAYSSIFGGLLFPGVGLVFIATSGATLLSYNKLWVPAIIVAGIMFFALYVLAIKRTGASVLSQVFFILLIAAAYGTGSILEINCGFDQAEPKQFPAQIVDHNITHGKSTHYHVTIGDCGAFNGTENMDVSIGFYEDEAIGTHVNVFLKPGVLGLPWFYMTR